MVGVSRFHVRSSYRGLAPHLQRAHAGRTPPVRAYSLRSRLSRTVRRHFCRSLRHSHRRTIMSPTMMKTGSIHFVFLMFSVFTLVSNCWCKESERFVTTERSDSSVTAQRSSSSSSNYHVVGIRTLVSGLAPNSGHVAWSPDSVWITYDIVSTDGFTDIWRIHPDGTGRECLTSNHPNLPSRFVGNSAWHPNCRWIVFQAETPSHFLDFMHEPCMPGAGYFNDLYVMNLQTPSPRAVYKLTSVRTGAPAGGSLHPQFSSDGSKLLWGDMEKHEGYYGNWRMAVADFVTSPKPHLENTRYYEPTPMPRWFETHDWSPDGKRIYFTATPVEGMDDNGMDICAMDFSQPKSTIRLTFSSGKNGEPDEWDEHAHLSPRGDVLSFISSAPYGVQHNAKYGSWMKTDVWLMNVDGTGHRRITFFNEPGHAEFQGRTIAADNCWNPAAIENPSLAVAMYASQRNEIQIKVIDFRLSL